MNIRWASRYGSTCSDQERDKPSALSWRQNARPNASGQFLLYAGHWLDAFKLGPGTLAPVGKVETMVHGLAILTR